MTISPISINTEHSIMNLHRLSGLYPKKESKSLLAHAGKKRITDKLLVKPFKCCLYLQLIF